ncbi:bifunctional phosphopantothenoylcysteine decarboxylase/phosphopantothenate--cysteine ligase CoaBC [Pontimonas sp.]|jgi:phosphopantothenoylcysteine decarboxylase/phosphopantothenate--cysteine ligase|nr:bifunctional phosphopantothenoylcysteine decarboxylase/phosphopantothenate--cysteine ligase CoaBC [Pontimonas sp.]
MAPTASSTPRIVVGVTGGIAAYKAVSLVRGLVKRGATVTVIPTESALRFVGRPTWEAVSRNPVATELFDDVATVRHVSLGQQADLIIIAPATAHSIASLASGLAGDLLGTTVLASQAPVLLAPAMHTEMWEHASVQANIDTLISRGVHVLGPASGELTGGDIGAGRMVEPEDIAEAAWALFVPQTLLGKTVLISAGGTREPLDPVRFLGNRSTGEMGVELARAAQVRGAEVVLVAAHLEVSAPSGVEVVTAATAEVMRQEMVDNAPRADVIILAAAVADWVAEAPSVQKISKKQVGATFSPTFVQAPDIAAQLGAMKRPDQLVVGFAAETSDDSGEREAAARAKLDAKNLDAVVVNQVGEQVGFGNVVTTLTLFTSASPQSWSVTGKKHSVAGQLLDALLDR